MQVVGSDLLGRGPLDQICFNGETLSFVQNRSLYRIDRSKELKRVKLRSSKVEGRQYIMAYANLNDGSILTYSFDYCVSLVKFKESSMKHTTTITKQFLCPFCFSLFNSWNNLHKQHIHLHKGPVQCSIKSCKIVSKDFYSDKIHRKHCGYRCDDCGKIFKNIDRFKVHLRVHM